MQKLLYITTNIDNSGGVSKLLSVKLNFLVRVYGYEVFVLNTTGDSSSLFYSFDEKIQFCSLSQGSGKIVDIIFYGAKLNKAIVTINPDIIINCDNGLKGVLLPFMVKKCTPIIYENHSSKKAKGATLIVNLKLSLQAFFFSISVKKYKWIVVYEYAKNYWESKNIMTISNPLSFDLPQEKTSLKQKVIIAVGRFSYQKGYDKLLKIWMIVARKHPNWILKIYGEGSFIEYKELAKTFGVSDSVQFFEPVENIKKVYLNASMLLNTSRFEPFGLALIEAMACGLPVFAFENTLGPKSYIDNNENGFLIEEDDFNDYADKITRLIKDKVEMKRISMNAQESVEKFEMDGIMKQWHELFQSIN